MGVRGDEIYRIKEEERKGVGHLGRQAPFSSTGCQGRPPWGMGESPRSLLTVGSTLPCRYPYTSQAVGAVLQLEDNQRVPVPLHTLGSHLCLLILHHNSIRSRSLWTPSGFSDSQPDGSHLNPLSFLADFLESSPVTSWASEAGASHGPLSWSAQSSLPPGTHCQVQAGSHCRLPFRFLRHLNVSSQKPATWRDGNNST